LEHIKQVALHFPSQNKNKNVTDYHEPYSTLLARLNGRGAIRS